MADIFLSYASEDRERIVPIVQALEQAGWSVFWDRKTPVGMSWEDYIEAELQQASCVLALWSQVSVGKRWVRMEAGHGLDRGCLVPARIDPVAPPFGFGDRQFADLCGWTGDSTDGEWLALVAAIERFAGPRNATTATQPPPERPQPPAPKPKPIPETAVPGASAKSKLPPTWAWVAALVIALVVALATLPELFRPAREPRPTPHPEPTPVPIPTPEPMRQPDPTPEPARSVTTQPAATARPLPELLPIAAGCFDMGSPAKEPGRAENEGPQHPVCLKPFQISRHEITFDQYDAYAREKGKPLPEHEGWGRADRPVININWQEAQDYAGWLSTQTGQSCRLPTEAEWEYAARAGTGTPWFWGDTPDGADAYAWYIANSGGKTQPVGTRKRNPWGLHDTAGNVWEWVEDCWHDNYEGAPADGHAWLDKHGGDCGRRVLRGGSWRRLPGFLRSAFRSWRFPDYRFFDVGFRVVCRPPSSTVP